ncbi:MAG: hypothetical protein Q8O67_19865 [Deltaproteobacteria bacterium]|nr:hypothetical protein [Deltaproteobacteria bacterium]
MALRLFAAVVVVVVSGCFAPDGAAVLGCFADTDCRAGERCDEAVGRCVDEDVADVDVVPPRLVGLTVAPAATRLAPVTITVVADAELASATLGWSSAEPPSGTVVDGDTATSVVDPAGLAEGSHVVVDVTLVDLAGNSATLPTSVVVVVDRTAPRIDALTPPPATVADDATFSVCGRVNERAVVSALVDDTVGICSDEPSFCCTFALVPRAVGDGARAVVFSAIDVAGNVGSADALVDVDAAAPRLDPLATRLAFSDADDNDVAAPVAGGSLRVELVFDEALASPPVARIDDSATTLVVVDAARAAVEIALPLDLAPGAHELRLDGVIDALGHRIDDVLVARLEVVAPAIGCGDLANECVDGDGDGWRVGACNPATATDCDDDDAATYPGGLEIPDDGKANDCVGDDDTAVAMIAEGRAVVVNGDDVGLDPDGSLARPFHDLQEADDLAGNDVELLVLVGRTISATPAIPDGLPFIRRSMAGGYVVDAGGALVRDAQRPRINDGLDLEIASALIARVEAGVSVGAPLTVVDSQLFFFSSSAPLLVARCDLEFGLNLEGTGQSLFSEVRSDSSVTLTSESTIVRSRFTARLSVSSNTTVVSSEVADVEVDATTILLVHSLLRADRDPGVSVGPGGAATLLNCTVTGVQFASEGPGVVNVDPDPPRTSSYQQAQGGPLVVLDPVAATTTTSASIPGARVDLNGRCRVGAGTLGPVEP